MRTGPLATARMQPPRFPPLRRGPYGRSRPYVQATPPPPGCLHLRGACAREGEGGGACAGAGLGRVLQKNGGDGWASRGDGGEELSAHSGASTAPAAALHHVGHHDDHAHLGGERKAGAAGGGGVQKSKPGDREDAGDEVCARKGMKKNRMLMGGGGWEEEYTARRQKRRELSVNIMDALIYPRLSDLLLIVTKKNVEI